MNRITSFFINLITFQTNTSTICSLHVQYWGTINVRVPLTMTNNIYNKVINILHVYGQCTSVSSVFCAVFS